MLTINSAKSAYERQLSFVTPQEKQMTADEYRNTLRALGINQAYASRFLGISLRTSHGYANGSRIPHSVAMVLRLLVQYKLRMHDIERLMRG